MNPKKPWTIFFLLCLALCVCTHAHANEISITLQSGEVIRGTLIREANGVVEIKHAILGDLKIDRALITNMTPIANAQVTTPASTSAPRPLRAPRAAAAPPRGVTAIGALRSVVCRARSST